MKIKALHRSPSSHQIPGSTSSRQPRNLDPALHPFERAREYTRALNATKLDRVFAAPFVAQLGGGHVDGVYSLAKDPTALSRLASGAGDGVVKVWDLPARKETWRARAHDNMVRGVCWTRDARLLSCAADRTVKLFDPLRGGGAAAAAAPVATFLGDAPFTAVSHHRSRPAFAASGGAAISVYDTSRPSSAPAQTLRWPTSVDTITTVSLNQVEPSIAASAATDRGVVLYDLRTDSALGRCVLTLQSNAIAWNPVEAFNFAVANEDHNAYVFDMRKMDRALNVLRDHVAAVMDVEFSPTGEELVTASYDRSIRLWNRDRGHSRDIYHTKRMQRVFSCRFTPDSAYVLSGSDDGNIRLWRSQASARAGAVQTARQRQSLEYADALKRRYAHMPEVRRIARHRHVPKTVKRAAAIKGEEVAALKRKEENERRHTKKGKARRRSEREKMVLAVEE
ncbi:WD40-repeat-containing domain protein [Lineolata rhizophorae]|uniref:DDB1- and CUL4-associated factor 13 n=1 Tax=Lineolata rhizophorae TaxID=578093 RepID=A0A6A6NV20_9PEZI|nr:WD40-repeat-containing domain protein [Lineolata rhizophorae]